MTSVESQAGPGSYGGQQGGGGGAGTDREAWRPGYGTAIAAFALLVLVGAWCLNYMRGHDAPLYENSMESSSGKVEAVAVMGEQHFIGNTQDFQGADAVGVMGHSILDLRQAAMTESRAEIDAVAVMGQVVIIVPPDWEVVPDDVLTVGSLVNRARHSDVANPRTVKLTGAVFLGEILVRR